MRTCITTSETAAKLGKTVNWLYRHRGELVAKFGFPRPLAATGCYDELAVDLWIDQQSGLSGAEQSDKHEQIAADDRILKRIAAFSRAN